MVQSAPLYTIHFQQINLAIHVIQSKDEIMCQGINYGEYHVFVMIIIIFFCGLGTKGLANGVFVMIIVYVFWCLRNSKWREAIPFPFKLLLPYMDPIKILIQPFTIKHL